MRVHDRGGRRVQGGEAPQYSCADRLPERRGHVSHVRLAVLELRHPRCHPCGEARGAQLAVHSRRALLPDAVRRWLSKDHPDPDAKNLRDIWLPALEWYYSERVRQLNSGDFGVERRAKDANGKPLSDEAVKEAADFGVFIE